MAPDYSRIERKTLIRAQRSRVWKAITDLGQFSTWFGVTAEGQFRPGEQLRMTSTVPGHAGVVFYMTIYEITPESRFSWRWHPGADIPGPGSDEPMTLVEFLLSDAEGGTLVTVVESGFDRLDVAKRAKAFQQNSEGWDFEIRRLVEYVETA